MRTRVSEATRALDNVFWHTLAGKHSKFSVGSGDTRRYARGFFPLVGFADPESPDFDALAPHCQPGERFYCDGWAGPAPAGWRVEFDSRMRTMVWHGTSPAGDEAFEPTPLGPRHLSQVLALAGLTRSVPFGPRTFELGDYVGHFDENGTLLAMAGERLHADAHREISAVCTHPDHRGKGLARRLMTTLIRRQLRRNESPFLRVMVDNPTAHRLYEWMGFRNHRESTVRIVSYRTTA